ncbi:hypothetical protein K1719_022692 [Acacia pycnantha]|nr:hypothetical protein K1719_022692 [Acacia pycnantha]
MKLFLAKELTLFINIPLFQILFLHCSSCHSLDRITPTKPLKNGDVFLSDGATFALGFFTPCNNFKNRFIGVWYNQVSEQTVVWVANRDNPLGDSTPGIFSIDIHGNIVLVANDTKPNPIWSSNVSISSSPTKTFAKLLETGNLVLIEKGTRRVLWQSFDYPCDTLLPLMKLGLDKKTGLNRFLTSWKSPNDPRPGNMNYKIDSRGYPQFFVYRNEDPIYRVGSWTGQRWGGHLRRYTWQPDGRIWQEILHIPRENCDHFRQCGSNSYCDSYYVADEFQCLCLPGFEPRNPHMRNGLGGGCVRKKNASTCQSGEGFVKVARMKLPDTSKVRLDKSMSMSLEECEEKCQKDCSCEAYASANEVTLRGCLTWHADMEDMRILNNVGQNLYVRVDAVELAKYENKHHGSLGKKGMVTLLVVSVCVLMLLITFVYWFAKNNKQARRRRLDEYLVDRGKDSDLSLFNLSDIIAATENFSNANKLGQCGFGSVYKGLLQNGMTIAVKRLSKHSGKGIIEDFTNEVTLMANLQHRNLVKIFGCCIQGNEKMLIYEYLPNKSLDTFIFDQGKKFQLDWRKRFDIISGVARGILYLHHDSRLRIIHRDLKASNVLLDSTLNPKISDFGMARIFGGDQIEANTNNVVGTYGYMSPKYAMEGLFSIKSDVYSFGVLLLEIVTGRKCHCRYDDITNTLVGHILEMWREGRTMDVVDPSLRGETCLDELVIKCINIGLLCVQDCATDRPTMLEVISMLDNDIVLPPPKQPGFMFKKTTYDQSNPCASGTEEFYSLNGMSTTEIEAR